MHILSMLKLNITNIYFLMLKNRQNNTVKRARKRQKLSHIWSLEQANKEGLYFPKRRVRINNPSKVKILKRIESQDFKGATEQLIVDLIKIILFY